MTTQPSQPALSPEQESLLLAAVDGQLGPAQQAELEQLFHAHPALRDEVAAMRADRLALQELEPDDSVDLVEPVLARIQPPVLRRMEPGRAHRRLRLSPTRIRTLAAAAAVLIIAAFGTLYVRSFRVAAPADDSIALTDPVPAPPDQPSVADASADPSPVDAADADRIAARAIEVATRQWTDQRAYEPNLDEAASLLVEGRLLIRVLARSDAEAHAGLSALQNGLDQNSRAWAIAGRIDPQNSRQWSRPLDQGPVMAYDEQADTMIQVPRRVLVEVWSAHVQAEPTAIASLVHVLDELGWTVRLEASPEPVNLTPDSLQDALWWTSAPSTWSVSGTVPIVIDALRR